MTKINGVLFDLDGTLLDTADDLGAALNYVLKQHCLPQVSAEKYRPVASDGAKGLLELGFKEKLQQYNFNELRESFLNYYAENIAQYTTLYDGIAELITFIDNKNIPWGIVTNKPIGLTHLLLPNFPEFINCRVVVGGDSLSERKPHPAPILYALDKIQISAEECFYIGDAPRDIEAGQRANMPTIIAGWGYIPNIKDCEQWQADHTLLKPYDIASLLS